MKRITQILVLITTLICSYSCTEADGPIKVESVSLDKKNITLTEGESHTLKAVVMPADAENKSVTWNSANTSVATVTSDGKVTAIAAGATTITVKSVDGEKSDACAVTVNAKIYPVESVALDQNSVTITAGETINLTATISPDNATNKAVNWSTSDASVATVTEGVVTAIAPGTATITVKTVDGEKSDACEVTVEAAVLKDVNSISDLAYTTNIPMDEFAVTWSGVANAAGYKCWYVLEGDDYETPADAIDNGNGTWTAKSSTAMGAAKYTFYAIPIPIEGHALKNDQPSSIVIDLPKWDNTSFSYRFMSTDIEEGVEYETDCYDLKVRYKNIKFRKSDNTEAIADNWYLYTATPVDNLNHIAIWYSLNYDNKEQSIRVYSSTTPGVKEQHLTPDAKILSGKWKAYYKIPEGHKYIYIEGRDKSNYLLWTSFSMYSYPQAE